jgi:hypothetical protein
MPLLLTNDCAVHCLCLGLRRLRLGLLRLGLGLRRLGLGRTVTGLHARGLMDHRAAYGVILGAALPLLERGCLAGEVVHNIELNNIENSSSVVP